MEPRARASRRSLGEGARIVAGSSRHPARRPAILRPAREGERRVDSGSVLHAADLELAHRASLGDEHAFAAWYERCFDAVYASALRRRGEPEAAEALTERVFVTALDALDSYRGDVPLAAWIYAIARDAARSAPREAPAALDPMAP
jgi:hypothetical protein